MSNKRSEEAIRQLTEGWRQFFWEAFNALHFNGISGAYAEFGSYGGNTLGLAHQQMELTGTQRHLWAFDSFKGLPASQHSDDKHPAWIPGFMSMSLQQFRATLAERGVPESAYTAVEGFFEQSLPPLGASGDPADIALAYIDCDMYSSTKTVLTFLEPRLKHGMIVAFDDYHCWTATSLSGERKALLEFNQRHPRWVFSPFRKVGWGGESFVVEDGALLRTGGQAAAGNQKRWRRIIRTLRQNA